MEKKQSGNNKRSTVCPYSVLERSAKPGAGDTLLKEFSNMKVGKQPQHYGRRLNENEGQNRQLH